MFVCRRVLARTLSIAAVGILLVACSDAPSKPDALRMVQRDVKEDATCTLPINVMPLFKMQHTTKAVCVPREVDPAGKKTFDDTMACLDALVAAGITQHMPADYMSEWPDEVSSAGFDSVGPYERRARNLMFKGCVAMGAGLRNGQFKCGEAKADKALRMTKTDATHAQFRYSRTIELDKNLPAIDKACGSVTRPGPDATATFEKSADGKWNVLPEGATPSPAPSK